MIPAPVPASRLARIERSASEMVDALADKPHAGIAFASSFASAVSLSGRPLRVDLRRLNPRPDCGHTDLSRGLSRAPAHSGSPFNPKGEPGWNRCMSLHAANPGIRESSSVKKAPLKLLRT